MRSLLVVALSSSMLAACDSGSSTLADSGSGSGADAAAADAAADDAAPPAPDAGADAGVEADSGSEDASSPADSGPMLGPPIDAPPRAWTWVDFPDSFCDDGTPTGIGINTSSTSSNVFIFLNGGGACWDYQTCVDFDTSTHGPFGAAQFAQISPFLTVGLYDRTDRENPFRDWSWVFVPYCTGDVHGGNNIATYVSPGGVEATIHHVGHANLIAFFNRLAPTFTDPSKLVLSGASAGGFGALFNYATAREYWPNGQMYLIDDSGPPLIGSAVANDLVAAWFASWRIDLVLDPLCGQACRTDLSAGITALAARYPNDRLSLLSSLRDQVIRNYVGLTPATFETELLRLSTDVLDPTTNFKYFFIPGESHVMLGAPRNYSSNNKVLLDWIREQVEDDAAWSSTKP